MLRSGDHLAPLPTKTNSPTATTRRQGGQLATPATRIALLQCCSNAASHCRNGVLLKCLSTIAAMPVLLQCLCALRQCPYCCNASAHCANACIATMPQRIAAIPISMLVLPQYCCNADAACNALQHCRNTYCRNIEAHCRNAPFVASLRQCCYCKGHCGNALWHCRNTPIFSRCFLKHIFNAVHIFGILDLSTSLTTNLWSRVLFIDLGNDYCLHTPNQF